MIVSLAITLAKLAGLLVIVVLACLVYGYLKGGGRSN
jgi:hypothetical protein